MLESVLSSRRSSPKAEDGDGDDESKKKKHFWFPMRTTNTVSGSLRAGSVIPCAVISFIMFAMGFLIRDSRNFACVGQREMLSRLAVFENMDGLASDFGALGVPWCRSKEGKKVEWTTKDLLKGLEEFVPIYETRPIKNNMFGMGFDHSFGLWFMARWLKPEIMIESGAFKGHSTWVLRQAMPETRIISLSPRHPEKYLMKGAAYVDSNCTYFAGKDFLDFGSINWAQVLKKHGVTNISRALVFFDDHQNELKRLKQALGAGFRHLIFEDNYDTGTGDHYSLRQICDQFYIRGGGHSCFRESDEARIRETRKGMWDKAVNRDELCGEGDAWWGVKGEMRDDFSHKNKVITLDEHYQNSRFVESVLDLYWELPPVAGPALTHQTRYDPARSIDPIIEEGRFGIFQKLGLTRLDLSVFNGYTQMVYVQISPQS